MECWEACDVYSDIDVSRVPAHETLQERVKTWTLSKGIKHILESIN